LTDYFTFLGLTRKLGIDVQALDRRYRALSRQFHPDYFHNASPSERRVSLERSSYLNDAYRTLKNPVTRIEYLLKLEAGSPRGSDDPQRAGAELKRGTVLPGKNPPVSLLEEVFALNEELGEIREMRGRGAAPEEWQARLERAQQPIEAKRIEHEAEIARLSSQWDAAIDRDAPLDRRRAILEALGSRFLERNYISNLLVGIARELAD
jgi:molecular chaperone HscB